MIFASSIPLTTTVPPYGAISCYDNGSQAKSKRNRHATIIPGLGENPAPFEVPAAHAPLGAFQHSGPALRSSRLAILVELIPRVTKINGLFETVEGVPPSAAAGLTAKALLHDYRRR